MQGLLEKKWKRHVKSFLFYLICVTIILYVGFAAGNKWTYKEKTHCCRHLSLNMEEKLESYGFDVKIVTGESPDGKEKHMWVNINGVDIDSVCLLPLISQHYFPVNRTVFDSYDDYVIARNEWILTQERLKQEAKNESG